MLATVSALLVDDSSQATRSALVALRVCLVSLLHSYHADEAIKLLLILVRLKTNRYWLVKARDIISILFPLK